MKSTDRIKEIDRLKAELARLEAEEKAYLGLSNEKKLAIALYDKRGLRDDDGWYYEKGWDEVSSPSHYRYLKRAEAILDIVDFNTAIKILRVI
jgi:hypothetical protein